MERERVARVARMPVEAITALVLGMVVFLILGGAVATGYLPLPHI
jgi:hypothetical protein